MVTVDNLTSFHYTLAMKEQIEPLSPIKANSIWTSPRIKNKKRLWNFANRRDRGQLAELGPKIKQVGFNTGIYQFGPYVGNLADIKEFAAMKGLSFLQNGAVKYKV